MSDSGSILELVNTPATKLATALRAPSASSADAQALEVVSRVLPELTPQESVALRGVARLETFYGRGWRIPSAIGSRNWGAITAGNPKNGSCGADAFLHKDSRRDPKTGKLIVYQTCFRKYPTEEAAAKHLAKVMLKQNVRAAANNNDLEGISRAMRENRYYLGVAKTREGQIAQHHSALKRHTDALTAKTEEQNPFEFIGPVLPPDPDPIGPGGQGASPLGLCCKLLQYRGLLSTSFVRQPG